MKKRIECTVTGRVQLVMFRDFTTRRARRLGLVGEVWNEQDGTVRVIAEGDELALTKLISSLSRGSLLSRVTKVDHIFSEFTGAYTQFVIRFK